MITSETSLGPGSSVGEKRKKRAEIHDQKKFGQRSGGLGRGKGQRHPFPSLDYRSPRFARRFFFFIFRQCGSWSLARVGAINNCLESNGRLKKSV